MSAFEGGFISERLRALTSLRKEQADVLDEIDENDVLNAAEGKSK